MKRSAGTVLALLVLAAGLCVWLLLRSGDERGGGEVLRPRAPTSQPPPVFGETVPAEPPVAEAEGAPAAVELLAPAESAATASHAPVRGRVLRAADRSPIANAMLWMPSAPTVVVHSLADGTFELPDAPADAELYATINPSDRLAHVALAPEASARLEVEVVLDTGWILPGTVRDSTGRPLADARVIVDDDRPWESTLAVYGPSGADAEQHRRLVSRETRTGPDGSFRLLDIPYEPDGPGEPLRLRARAAAVGCAEAELPVDVPPGPAVARPVEFRLARGGAIAGHLATRDGRAVVCGNVALVYESRSDGANFAPRGLQAESRTEGAYRLESVPPGRYVLAAWGGSVLTPGVGELAPGIGPVSGSPSFVGNVDVREGETTVVDVVLASDRALDGVVADAAGNPVAGAEVDLREHVLLSGGDGGGSFIFGEGAMRSIDSDAGHATEIAHKIATIRTDAQGRFRFEALAPGGKQIIARKPADPWLGWALRDLVLDPVVPAESLTLVLPRAVRLAGRVLDEAGRPVPQANVENWSSEFPWENPAATTDEAGRFVLAIEAPGSLMLGIGAEGFTATNITLELTHDKDDLEIRLQHSPAVRGIVLDAVTLQPVTSYGLTLAGPHSIIQTSVQDAAGAFRMEWGDEGSLAVYVSADGYESAQVDGVDPAQTVAEPLRVLLQRK